MLEAMKPHGHLNTTSLEQVKKPGLQPLLTQASKWSAQAHQHTHLKSMSNWVKTPPPGPQTSTSFDKFNPGVNITNNIHLFVNIKFNIDVIIESIANTV
jgi:hypothetical protein